MAIDPKWAALRKEVRLLQSDALVEYCSYGGEPSPSLAARVNALTDVLKLIRRLSRQRPKTGAKKR